jgi:hypothetical protein
MVHAARASTARAVAPSSPIQSLAKHNRKPMQLTENKHQRPKSIASFRRNLSAPPPCPTNHDSRGTHHAPRFTTHQSLLTDHAFLIATQILNIHLTRSQETRKHFLIGTKYDISAPAPYSKNPPNIFLIATDRIQKIANPMKTKEKRFSNRNTEMHGGIGNLACPLNRAKARFILRAGSAGSKGSAPAACAYRFWVRKSRHPEQIKCAQARLPMLPAPRTANHQSLLTNHQSRLTTRMRLAWVCR